MATRNRRLRYRYFIPISRVQKLPAIREESPTKLFLKPAGSKKVAFSQEASRTPPLRAPADHHRRHYSPIEVPHNSLEWLVSDYLNYVGYGSQLPVQLAHEEIQTSCLCCSDRNRENVLRLRGTFTSHQFTDRTSRVQSPAKPPLKVIQNPEPKTLPRYRPALDPSTRPSYPSWDYYRPLPPMESYLNPELWRPLFSRDFDDIISHATRTQHFYKNSVLEADISYRKAMNKLQSTVREL